MEFDLSGDWRLFVVRELPRFTADPDAADPGVVPRRQALVARYHGGTPVLFGWRRLEHRGPVEMLVTGPEGSGETGPGGADAVRTAGSGQLLNLPASAFAEPAASTAAGIFGIFKHWRGMTATINGLLAEDEPAGQRATMEEGLVRAWHAPFAWYLLAEPVRGEDYDEALHQANQAVNRTAPFREGSDINQLRADRDLLRLRELEIARGTGAWRLTIAAGARTPSEAAQACGLLCTAVDTTGLPYVLVPDDQPVPFVASTDLLARLTRPPTREIPGIRLVLRPEFDMTAERPPGAGDGVSLRLGAILDFDRAPTGPLCLYGQSLVRHTFICGATGSGKSQTTRALLEQATEAGIPWLVVEPAKAEYRAMANRISRDVIVIHPGASPFPAGLNPLEPSRAADGRRFPLQTHIDLIGALFLAAFDPVDPLPQVLSAALTRCYEELGWDLASDPPGDERRLRYPTLRDLQVAADRVVLEAGYGAEVRNNMRGFIRVRLASLRSGTPGRFFTDIHPLDLSELLRRNVVLELEDVGDDQGKAFLIGTVLVRLTEQLRLHGPSDTLRHLTVIEEAHRLLRAPGPAGQRGPGSQGTRAVEMFADMLAEVRAYGEGLVIAEQIPAKLLPDVIKNTAVKIVHRLPAADDREVVGATMNVTDEQQQFLVTLRPGEAAVFTDGMDFPVLAAMPDGTSRERDRAPAPIDAASLVAPRSVTCGESCRQVRCRLADMGEARRLLGDQPGIGLWAEAAVVCHLGGLPSLVPSARMRELMTAVPRRVLDCALSQAVDSAVAARTAAIGTAIPPDELSGHVVTVLRSRARCPGSEPDWCLEWFRHGDRPDHGVPQWKIEALLVGRHPPGETGPLQRAIGARPGTPQWAERQRSFFLSNPYFG
jgi:DNA helicase HerA-like ATPase